MGHTRTNDAYAWNGQVNVPGRSYTSNGLNQYSAVAGTSFTYDADQNLISDGTNSYVYDVENRLVSGTVGGATTTLRYDPLGRLYEVNGSATGITRFLYDGDDLVGEYDSAGNLLRRYVHGDGADQPEVWFEGAGVADAARRYLYADERGSVVAVSDSNGNELAIDSYDEYGLPDDWSATNLATKGRFRYTGQALIPELGMYYYKARMYSPTLGRFMQTDPIGYGDGMNMYRYVHGDPVNGVDPTGLWDWGSLWNWADCLEHSCIDVTAPPPEPYSCEMFNGCYNSFDDYCSRYGCGSPGTNLAPPPPPSGGTPPESNSKPQSPCSAGSHQTGTDANGKPTCAKDEIKPKQPAFDPSEDYCGSHGVDVPDGNWKEACYRHDNCYGTPADGNPVAAKEVCDFHLWVDIAKLCVERGLSANFCSTVGFTYFIGLAAGGWWSFSDAQKDSRR